MVYIATSDDFENDQNLEEQFEPEDIILAKKDVAQINNKDGQIPAQPLLDYTRERKEKFSKHIEGVEVDYSNHEMEDLTFVLQSIENREEDTLTPVLEQSYEDGEIFDRIKEDLEAEDPENILFARFPTFSKNWLKIDTDTELALAKTVDDAGADVYVAFPLTQEEEKSFKESLDDYIERMQTLAEETPDELKITATLHLVGLDYTAGRAFAERVKQDLPEDKFRFIGVTGSPIFTNKEPFRGVRDNSDRKLLVSNCPKKVNSHRYEDVGKMSLQRLYRIRGAEVVLQERSILGGGENDDEIELLQDDGFHFEKNHVENADSPIPDKVSIEGREETLLSKNNAKIHLGSFINEIALTDRAELLRNELDSDVSTIYRESEFLDNALCKLLISE